MKKLFFSLLAVVLLIEEFLWDALTFLGHRLIVLLRLERYERWLRQTSPAVALTAFLIPLLIVAPLNFVAFWLVAKGRVMQGIVTEIFAKLLGTLLVARVFALTKPQLMTFGWIRALYTTITHWLAWAHERIRQTAVYRLAQQVKLKIKTFRWWWRRK